MKNKVFHKGIAYRVQGSVAKFLYPNPYTPTPGLAGGKT